MRILLGRYQGGNIHLGVPKATLTFNIEKYLNELMLFITSNILQNIEN